MPGKTGGQLFRELIEKEKISKDIPKIIITGFINNDDVTELLDEGIICEIIYKPFSEYQIIHAIDSHVKC